MFSEVAFSRYEFRTKLQLRSGVHLYRELAVHDVGIHVLDVSVDVHDVGVDVHDVGVMCLMYLML